MRVQAGLLVTLTISAILVCFASRHYPSLARPTDGTIETHTTERSGNVNTQPQMIGKHEAIKAAIGQLGLIHYDAARAEAARVQLSSECLPFLGDELAKHETWKVELRDVDLAKDAGRPELANPHIQHLVVIMAPGKAQTLKVTSVWPEAIPLIAPYPSVGEEERQLRAIDTSYPDLPDQPPGTSMLKALASDDTMFWSKDVKQIYAVYVKASTIKYMDKPVWVIELRGFPPFVPPVPPGADPAAIPENARNHIRNVIDAQNGEWLGAGTAPQSMPMEKKGRPLEQRY